MFSELIEAVRRLRAECPWDRKQTVASTRPLVLNEAYELDEALGSGDAEHIAEELGDYLFMGVFLADVLAREKGTALEAVLAGVVAKLKRRHPHIYGDTRVTGAEEVLRNWDRIKKSEKGEAGKETGKSALDRLPGNLPALKESQLMQERCARVGFDWPGPELVLDKVSEEVEEVRVELTESREKATPGREKKEDGGPGSARLAEELGDLLFVLVNLCRHFGFDAESVLRDANGKFARRFRLLEEEYNRSGQRLEHSTLEEMDRVWERVKAAQRAAGRT